MSETLRGKTVLIVDDEADLREPLVIEFEMQGCRVLQARNGREAMELVRRESVDAVISDIRMPGGDGIELLKNIKQLHHEFPVVMLVTGFSDLTKEEAYHLGAEMILSKPFDLDEIDEAVTKILTPRETRWQKAAPDPCPVKIEHTFENLAAAMADGRFGVGRGGVYLGGFAKQAAGTPLSLDIKFRDGDLLQLEATGFIRWVRSARPPHSAEACGVEFESLPEQSRADIIRLTKLLKTIPYIPNAAT